MTLRDKMLAVIADTNDSVAEREELVEMSRSHERAILTDHTVDAPKICFHNGIALSD